MFCVLTAVLWVLTAVFYVLTAVFLVLTAVSWVLTADLCGNFSLLCVIFLFVKGQMSPSRVKGHPSPGMSEIVWCASREDWLVHFFTKSSQMFVVYGDPVIPLEASFEGCATL